VDVLFDSVASVVNQQAVGVLMTGMGADGAQGLLSLCQAGAATFTQDKRSCVVYGMPKVAVELGASQQSARPTELPRLILRTLHRQNAARAPRSR
jgi:two-component system chemotaxis response regulator CheB